MSRPKILITNDDSLYAKGIKHLSEIAKNFGEVIVVAPNKPQSGMSHAMTFGKPLRLKERNLVEGVKAFECTGTPVDCVKLGLDKFFDEKPDLVLSGINHGSNASINVIYSGTMAAAREGALSGINSIGFSSLTHDPKGDFSACDHFVPKVIEMALQYGFPSSRLLNVNIPDLELEKVKGIKICRAANARWIEDYEEREDPYGHKYYWTKGEFVNSDKRTDTDVAALADGYVSVVPVQIDFTSQESLDFLNNTWKISS